MFSELDPNNILNLLFKANANNMVGRISMKLKRSQKEEYWEENAEKTIKQEPLEPDIKRVKIEML